MILKVGERLIINEGITGWGKTLAVTNKRLLILEKDKIIGETPIEDVSRAHTEIQMLTNLTQLKIKLKNGREMSVIFRSSENGRLYRGSDRKNRKVLKLTNKYARAINQAVSQNMATSEAQ